MGERSDYQANLREVMRENRRRGLRPSLLLHSCCAPCSSHVLQYLQNDFETTVFFYNPGIMPRGEYEKRLSEQKRLCEIYKIPYIEGVYDNQNFLENVRGKENEAEGGARCEICYKMRLERTAKTARAGEFSYFGTTLSVSPHKNADLLNELGRTLAKKYNLLYLISDFKKEEGYKNSVELSKKYDLYRQDYCGCRFEKDN